MGRCLTRLVNQPPEGGMYPQGWVGVSLGLSIAPSLRDGGSLRINMRLEGRLVKMYGLQANNNNF